MNRAVMARRAASRPPRRGSASPSTNPALRPSTIVTGTGHVKKSTALKLTATQKNSQGRPSEWNTSMEFFTDPKWSQTVRSQNV